MKRLPVADGPSARGSAPAGAPPGAPEPPAISSRRLIATLTLAGAVAGLGIVLAYGWARPRIQAHRAAVLRAAIDEVLGGPDRYEVLYVDGDGLRDIPPAGADTLTAERVYLGFGADGRPIGFAVEAAEPGFQDVVRLLFGYDPVRGRLLGMTVLESRETPGLGERIETDSSFAGGFHGAVPPLVGVKSGRATGDEHEVDMITGATISSRTVIRAINERIERLEPLLRAYEAPEEEAP